MIRNRFAGLLLKARPYLLALLVLGLAACSTPAPSGDGGTDDGGGGNGGNLEERSLSATDLAFDTDNLAVTAGEAFSVRLNNNDEVEHNFSIYADDSAEEPLFEGEVVDGGDSIVYDIEGLDAGEYYFQCDIHPDMNGTLTVGD